MSAEGSVPGWEGAAGGGGASGSAPVYPGWAAEGRGIAAEPAGVVEGGLLDSGCSPAGVYEHGEYRQHTTPWALAAVAVLLGAAVAAALWRWTALGADAIAWGGGVFFFSFFVLGPAQLISLRHAWVAVLADGRLLAGRRVAVPVEAVTGLRVERGWWRCRLAKLRGVGSSAWHTRGEVAAVVHVAYRDPASGAPAGVAVGTNHPEALVAAIRAVAARGPG